MSARGFRRPRLVGYVDDDATVMWPELARMSARGDLAPLVTRRSSDALLRLLPVVVSATPGSLALARSLRTSDETVPLLLVHDIRQVSSRLPALAAAGLDDVFPVDQAGAFARLLETLEVAATVNTVSPVPVSPSALAGSTLARAFGAWCARTSFRRRTVAEAAAVLGVSRRTLERVLLHEALPSPSQLLRATTLARVKSLRASGLAWMTIASLLGFASPLDTQRFVRRIEHSRKLT